MVTPGTKGGGQKNGPSRLIYLTKHLLFNNRHYFYTQIGLSIFQLPLYSGGEVTYSLYSEPGPLPRPPPQKKKKIGPFTKVLYMNFWFEMFCMHGK